MPCTRSVGWNGRKKQMEWEGGTVERGGGGGGRRRSQQSKGEGATGKGRRESGRAAGHRGEDVK